MKREVWNHPKTYELAEQLEIPTEYAAGLLGKLWDWCADVAPQGDIGKWSDGAIARALNWKGDPAEFVQAFVDSGWLDRDAKYRLVVHDIRDHAQNWWHAKLKKLNLDFVEPTGPPETPETQEPSIEASIEPSKIEEKPTPEAAILQTSANPCPSQETTNVVFGEPEQVPPSPTPKPASPPSEFEFPVSGKGAPSSGLWTLPQSKLDEYREAYPGLDVDSEMRKARQWCRDNALKRKSPSGMLAFLTKWLNRAQNSGGSRGSPSPQKTNRPSGTYQGASHDEGF